MGATTRSSELMAESGRQLAEFLNSPQGALMMGLIEDRMAKALTVMLNPDTDAALAEQARQRLIGIMQTYEAWGDLLTAARSISTSIMDAKIAARA